MNFAAIEDALDELRAGRIILCMDDPDRENEGDMICAAQFATTENVNFMATHARGLICTPMSAEIAKRLGLEQMVKQNTDNHGTAFTVSVDHIDTSTGISAWRSRRRDRVSTPCRSRKALKGEMAAPVSRRRMALI